MDALKFFLCIVNYFIYVAGLTETGHSGIRGWTYKDY